MDATVNTNVAYVLAQQSRFEYCERGERPVLENITARYGSNVERIWMTWSSAVEHLSYTIVSCTAG